MYKEFFLLTLCNCGYVLGAIEQYAHLNAQEADLAKRNKLDANGLSATAGGSGADKTSWAQTVAQFILNHKATNDVMSGSNIVSTWVNNVTGYGDDVSKQRAENLLKIVEDSLAGLPANEQGALRERVISKISFHNLKKKDPTGDLTKRKQALGA